MFYKKYLILILISFTNIWGFSQKNQTLFHQLTTENGLSNNSITCVFKDSKGFIWIGTIDGLNRYDGYNFTVFKHISSDSLSISDNFISTVVEDSKGNLWIGTQGGGLNKYNPVLNRFTSFFNDINDSTSLPSNFIFHHNSMLLDNDTLLWIGTNNGLCCLNLKTNKFKRFALNYQNFPQNTFSDVRIIFDGLNNILWIGTNNGLIKFSKTKGILKVYQHYFNTSNSLSNNIITSIAERNDKKEIWIGTEEGLNIFNPQTETFKHYFSDKLNNGSISDNSITSITKDESGDFWIGTKSGGLDKYDLKESIFYHWENNPSNSNSLSDNYIDNLFYDKKGHLWIGTVNNGINLLDIKPKKIGLIKHEPGNPNSLSSNTIRSIYKDKEGILWIGTYGGGLNKYNGRNFVHYVHQPDNPNSLSHNIVSSIFEDSKGELWVGTWGGGLNILNKINGTFSRIYSGLPDFISDISEDNFGNIWLGCNSGLYIYNTKKSYAYRFDSETNAHDELTASSINKIIRDHNGNLWVATFDGLNKIILKNNAKPEIDSIIHFKKDFKNINSISENRTFSLHEDETGDIWIGTYTGGLNKLSVIKDNKGNIQYQFKCYTEKEGLSGNIIYGILEDKHNNLWMSTNNGISKFNFKKETFQNFNIDDGLQSNQFYWNAYFHDKTGEMYFGGINGLNYFQPDSIIISRNFPVVYITDFLLFNKSVLVTQQNDGEKVLTKSILFTKNIELSRRDYPFTFEFAAVIYKSQNKIKYAYKLENFDIGWLYTDAKKRYATYSHLRPGNYTFKVKSTNEDGIWNDKVTSINITVLPAIWETGWAFIIYAFILLLLLYFFRSQILTRARFKHEIQLQKLDRQRMEEYNDLKLRFFTNISHEFRTPLTLIIGPLEKLLTFEKIEKKAKDQLLLIQSGSKRLLHLINQLLEFRKIETGNFELKISKNNVIHLLQDIANLFNAKAKSNKLAYTVNLKINSAIIWFDEHIVETIVYNLLSNAFKFTPSGGKVSLSVVFLNEKEEEIIPDKDNISYMVIKVSDTGIGISQDKINEIFKSFYQINQPGGQMIRGTGIGLTLCKDLAIMHLGNINVNSTPNQGSEFTVKLSVHPSFFVEKNIKIEPEYSSNNQNITLLYKDEPDLQISTENIDLIEFDEPTVKNAPVILIIEDDIELIKFIGKLLEGSYKILYAMSGETGLKIAIKEAPDLMISDIMMPGMSGFEVCERIKTDIHLSHIPIILLTALSSLEDKLKGISTGADDYISKPFDQKLLIIRVEKLIEQRNKLRRFFQKEYTIIPNTPTLSSLDEQLLNKVINYIESKIAEPELGVDDISNEVGISSTHLYRKIKSLTDLSTNELIRKLRLKKAANLLSTHQGNVSQVMYDVGFTNTSYFAKCFQEEFGVTPKEFMAKK